MAKTVLEYVQATLAAMSSDEVDTISDTTEAMDVANQLKETYYELLNRQDWPFLRKPLSLTAAASATTPTQFTIPENVKYIVDLKYNISEVGSWKPRDLEYLEPQDFLSRFGNGETNSDMTLVSYGSLVKFFVNEQRWPQFWTSFDDSVIVMDAFNSNFESTLTSARIGAWGIVIPEFTISDSFVPLIPRGSEPLLQSELNRDCFHYDKQVESVTDERKAQRQLSHARRESSKVVRPNHASRERRGYGRK